MFHMSGIFGLIILALLAGGFIFPGVMYGWSSGRFVFPIISIAFLTIIVIDFVNRLKDKNERRKIWPIKVFFQQMVFIVGGGLSVFLVSEATGISVVILSSIVGVVIGRFWPVFGPAAFCGSFVGMASSNIFNGYSLFIATLFASLLFYLGGRNYLGVGGKLGTTAFFGTLLVAFFQGHSLITPWNPDFSILVPLLVLGALGTLATYYLAEEKKLGPVVGSGCVGIVGGILLPILFQEHGNLYANLVYCASFAGMASKKVLGGWPLFMAAGLISGFLFFTSLSVFDGLGGKLGTIAFVAVLVARFSLFNVIQKFANQKTRPT